MSINLGSRFGPALRLPALPPFGCGQKIGLFGGTFDPPHPGHFLASLTALRRLGLDRVWWLVTPGNPLKNTEALSPLADRIAAARALARDPRIAVTGFEAAIGARYTYQALLHLQRRCAGVHFVWIMGADNLAQLHRWRRWRQIVDRIPIAVVDRPGSTLRAAHSLAGSWLEPHRLGEEAERALPLSAPPAYVFMHGPRCGVSSTMLRAARGR